MAQNEVKATASLDTKPFEQGAAKMGDSLKKFAYETEGVMSKLARQLSATDLAAAAVFATIAKSQQVVRDSLKAYEDQQRKLRDIGAAYDDVVTRMDAYNSTIRENNQLIGEALTPLDEYRRKLEAVGSFGMGAIAGGFKDVGTAFSSLPKPVQTLLVMLMSGPGFGGLVSGSRQLDLLSQIATSWNPGAGGFGAGRPSGGGSSGAGGYTDAQLADMARARDAFGSRLDGITNDYGRGRRPFPSPLPNPYDSGMTPGGAYPWTYGGGDRDARWGTANMGDLFNTQDEIRKQQEYYARAAALSQQFGMNLTNNLMAAFEGSKSIMAAIRDSIVDTLKQALAEIAGRTIGNALLSGLTGGMTVGLSAGGRVSPALEPAMARASARMLSPGLSYEARRGRAF